MAKPRLTAASSKRRCAIYTRKSTEEGLEQEFNSLDAQREACAAYILSQRHEGWTLVPDLYDDGGFSGGTTERPGLKALLAEVAAGRVDVIVVYKVDRLTRSLADFAKIVEILDARDASFVSVTQAFNTTTSMGRLTLNVLLSFAQFEREVTGERIRDKIAASKAKGMWMGGVVPLGYRVEDRKLVICDAEAEQVRDIFRRYLALGSARALQSELDRLGIRSRGGKTISRGALYALLQNRLYIGEVVHKGTAYAGQHQRIIDADLFEAAQRQRADGLVGNHPDTNTAACSLLAGLMVDAHGRLMSPSHTSKGGRRYRYYVSQTDSTASEHAAWRVGAREIEQAVCTAISVALDAQMDQRLDRGDLGNDEIASLQATVTVAKQTLASGASPESRTLLATLVQRIDLAEDSIAIGCGWNHLAASLPEAAIVTAALPLGCVRTRKRPRTLIASNDKRSADPATVRLIARGFAARKALLAHPSIETAAAALGYSRDYIVALARLSYLAPDLVAGIVDGSISGVTSKGPLTRVLLPSDWAEQHAMLIPA